MYFTITAISILLFGCREKNQSQNKHSSTQRTGFIQIQKVIQWRVKNDKPFCDSNFLGNNTVTKKRGNEFFFFQKKNREKERKRKVPRNKVMVKKKKKKKLASAIMHVNSPDARRTTHFQQWRIWVFGSEEESNWKGKKEEEAVAAAARMRGGACESNLQLHQARSIHSQLLKFNNEKQSQPLQFLRYFLFIFYKNKRVVLIWGCKMAEE